MKKITYLPLVLLICLFAFTACKDEKSEEKLIIEITGNDLTLDVDENPSKGDLLGKVQASVNEGELSYEIDSQDPLQAITINNSNGEIRVETPSVFDFETNQSITATILLSAEGAESQLINVNISINDVEEPVIITAEDFSTSLPENPANELKLGTITASVSEGALNFALVSESPENALAVNNETGEIFVKDSALFDFEVNETIEAVVNLSADNAASKTVNITISLTDVDETREITFENFETTIDENPAAGTSLGTISASVPGGGLSYSLISESPENALSINSSTGEISVNEPVLFDYEFFPVLEATVELTAENANAETVTITVNLNDNTSSDIKPLVVNWKITDADKTITIPTNGEYEYLYNVDWGDNSYSIGVTGDVSHTYEFTSTNEYKRVKITGRFPAFLFDKMDSEESVKFSGVLEWGDNKWETFRKAFSGCKGLLNWQTVGTPDLTNVTDMSYMYAETGELHDFQNWDVSGVTDMSYMFYNAGDVWDITGWDVSNVVNMEYMFYNVEDLLNSDISDWNTASAQNMSYMFYNIGKLNYQLDDWNVGNVTNFSHMFYEANRYEQANLRLTNFNNWNVSSAIDMSYMFYGFRYLDSDFDQWDVSNVTNMAYMFVNCNYFFNGNVTTWDVSKVENMSNMFAFCYKFNRNIGGWNVSSVTKMSYMFIYDNVFNQNLSNWNTSNVTDFSYMFTGAERFDQNVGDWDLGSVEQEGLVAILSNTGLSAANYDATLLGWAQQANNLTDNMEVGVDGLVYCNYGNKSDLLAKGWTFVGDGQGGVGTCY